MGWQTKGGGCYYTRSRREGGRVVREYLGGGEMARLFAGLDALDRTRREAERDERRRAREAEAEGSRLTRWYVRAVENVLRAEMTAAGYHQHDRGQWRRKRPRHTGGHEGGDAMSGEMVRAAKAELTRREEGRQELAREVGREIAVRQAVVPDTAGERRVLVNAAMNGDAALEAQALACIRAFPAEMVLGLGNPKAPCLDLVSPSAALPAGRVIRAAVEQDYKLKLKQIEGDNPTPLETLLAERIVVLRFQLSHYEQMHKNKLAEGMTLDHSEHQQKRIERLHKQYVRAIESLAKVRRLQLPALLVGQVNIAGQQVNVAAGRSASGAAES